MHYFSTVHHVAMILLLLDIPSHKVVDQTDMLVLTVLIPRLLAHLVPCTQAESQNEHTNGISSWYSQHSTILQVSQVIGQLMKPALNSACVLQP